MNIAYMNSDTSENGGAEVFVHKSRLQEFVLYLLKDRIVILYTL